MFESSTFDSMGTIHTRSRNWMFATFGFNASILALLVAIPLLHPAGLPQILNPIVVEAPAPAEEPRPIPEQPQQSPSPTEFNGGRIQAPSVIPRDPLPIGMIDPPQTLGPISLGGPTGPTSADNPFNGRQTQPIVRQVVPPKPHVTSSVMEGMLLNKVLPIYPPLARAMRASGRVELQATISRAGNIENLHVMSGPAVFQQAALDAVKQWRYQPYLLNGQPVEVETTIDVNFTLN